MASNDFIGCNLQHTPFEEIVKGLLTVDDNGCVAVRVINSTDSGVPFAGCNSAHLDWKQIIKSAIELDANGNPALRLAATTPQP